MNLYQKQNKSAPLVLKNTLCGSGIARRGTFNVVVTAAIMENPGTGGNARQKKVAVISLLDSLRESCKNVTYLPTFTKKPTESRRTKRRLKSH